MGLWEKFLLSRISRKVIQAVHKYRRGHLTAQCNWPSAVQPGIHQGPAAHGRSLSRDGAHYLVGAPVVQGEDGEAEDDSRPGDVSSDGVSEDVERIRAREVALWHGSPVSFPDYAWLSI